MLRYMYRCCVCEFHVFRIGTHETYRQTGGTQHGARQSVHLPDLPTALNQLRDCRSTKLFDVLGCSDMLHSQENLMVLIREYNNNT